MSDSASAAGAATALPALDNTMGVLYLSALLTMGLWGAGTVQLAYYFEAFFATDPWWLQTIVFTTWLADTAGQALISQLCYTYLITNYANPAFLSVLQPTLLPIMFVTGVTSTLAQSFFVSRAYLLSKKNIFVGGGLSLLVSALFVSTVVFYGRSAHFTQFVELVPEYDFMHGLNVLSMVTDISISATLCVLLRGQKTTFRKTQSIINRLILFTLNTGILCALCAILTLVFNLAFPNTFLYMIFYIMVCRIYVNSLLASLNSRKASQRDMQSNINSISLSQLERSTSDVLVERGSRVTDMKHMSVNVSQISETAY